MSIPRVVLMLGFGLISSSGPTQEPIVKAAAAPAQPAAASGRTISVRIHVLPQDLRNKGRSAIQSWARARGGIQAWDIIVDGKTPWMFMHDTLVAHDHKDHHFELGAVHLSVSRREQVRWESDRAFCITNIKKDDHEPKKESAPQNPFPKLRTEMAKTKESCSGNGYQVESGPAELADSQMPQRYKVTFRIVGEKDVVDPDLVCEP